MTHIEAIDATAKACEVAKTAQRRAATACKVAEQEVARNSPNAEFYRKQAYDLVKIARESREQIFAYADAIFQI